jgi:AcrR family transcriptional regulator
MVSKKRNAIMESVLRLLEERPLNKITVKDIVDECGINRNTFYYHFEDISDLIEAIIISEVDRVMTQYRDISSMEECIEMAMRLGFDHRNAIYHIYNSSNRDFLERRLMEICRHAATRFVEKTAGGQIIRPEDRDIIIQSYKCELFGLVIDWLNSGMPQNMEERFLRLCELRRGSIEMMLGRSAVQ